jgi:hypothetical protein
MWLICIVTHFNHTPTLYFVVTLLANVSLPIVRGVQHWKIVLDVPIAHDLGEIATIIIPLSTTVMVVVCEISRKYPK